MKWNFLCVNKQIVKTAAVVSPIIALLVVTPVYTIRRNTENYFFILWFVYFARTIISWYLNVIILTWIKKIGIKKWMSVIISSVIMMIGGSILLSISPFKNPAPYLTNLQFTTVRAASTLSINLIVFILLDLIFTRETTLQLNKEIAELKFSNLEAEYKLLKEQVNPHFLFNALNISKSLIKKQPEKAENYIIQLSDFLRATVNNHQKSASFKDELELGSNYIALQKARFGNALCYSVNINEEKESFHLPFFTLVSLIENAIKHNSFSDKKPLEISIYTEDDFVFVKNNLHPKFVLASSKTGLININQRSRLLSGNEIEIVNTGNDFLVRIKLISA